MDRTAEDEDLALFLQNEGKWLCELEYSRGNFTQISILSFFVIASRDMRKKYTVT